MKIVDMINAVQKKLNIHVDGIAGPQTWSAIYSYIIHAELLEVETDKVDKRSETMISNLRPEVQSYARALVHKSQELGISIKIISGLRTYVEQDALYAQGRTINKDKNTVTNARGGYSNHNFGIAFDIGIFEGNKYLENSPKYKVVGALGMQLGLEWGGNWKSIVDQPHFQLRPLWAQNLSEKEMLKSLRERVEKNMAIYV